MTCRLCSWLCDRFCPPSVRDRALGAATGQWEDDFALGWEPAEEAAARERHSEARELTKDDPAAALALHLELADGGSAFSMLKAGWHYLNGHGTERDPAAAEEFYRRALCAGSWRATIRYASLLFQRGAHDAWPGTLGDGVDKGFIPSFFWLGWYSYKRSPSARTAREVRHLLETAAAAGHPEARLTLARWTAQGKFGWGEIPAGFRMILAFVRSRAVDDHDATEAARPAAADLHATARVAES